MFDIVIPVHNSMHHVRACLTSVFACATRPYRLYVVDDASRPYTIRTLREILRENPDAPAVLLANESNLGYLKSVNRGISEGSQPYVLLLNSDTVVLPGFLEKIEQAFEADPRAGVVNAVSNWANWTRICASIPAGYTVFELADHVDRMARDRLADIYNASGFCFAVRRALFDSLGLFDEAYGMGYWEEADFCMRAAEAGWRIVVKENLYVYHHGWGTFGEGGRNAHMTANEALFMKRWGAQYRKAERRQQRKNPVGYMAKTLDAPGAWMRRSGDSVAAKVSRGQAKEALKAAEREAERGEECPFEEAAATEAPSRGRIIYLTPGVALYGGIISIFQVVNELIRQGYDANIAACGTVDESMYRMFPTYFRGYEFPDPVSLIAGLPECALVVATRWDTVYWARALKRLRPDLRLLYFVQDYEPDFYADGQPELARQAEQSYRLIQRQIVKTRWLAQKLRPYGGEIHRIPLGLNLDFFHDYGRSRPDQVLALARPSSARRNFEMVKAVYASLHRNRPHIQLALYGEGYEDEALPFPVRSYGKLSRMEQVAEALNDSTVLLDCSTFQGFGRPGLEAMACGTAAVLTEEGGITQYAKHGHNCLLVNPHNGSDIVEKVLTLFDQSGLRKRLVEQGRATAREYSLQMEGGRTASLLEACGMRRRNSGEDERIV